jgi:iron(III) transport system substrate-binding protein
MLRLLALALTAATMLATAQPAKAQGSLTVYCSVLAEWCEIMRAEFERTTGVKVLMTVKSTGETFAQIRAEAGNPRADIWWGGTSDPHLEAAELGLTEEYRSPTLAKLHPWALKQAQQSGYKTLGIYAGTLGLVWNTEQLAKKKLPEPRCWADMLRPEYRDDVQMSHPGTSGTSYIIVATLVQIMGEDAAFDYLKGSIATSTSIRVPAPPRCATRRPARARSA